MTDTLTIAGNRTRLPPPLRGRVGEGGAGGSFSGKSTAVTPTPNPAPQVGGESLTPLELCNV
jgi:hypothetical protein